VLPFALATPPVGWLLCNGAVLTAGAADHLRAQLIAAGNPYGFSGSDPKLPDMRGEFPRGVDAGRGVDTGRTLGSAQKGTMLAIDDTGASAGTPGTSGYVPASTTTLISNDLATAAGRVGADVSSRAEYPDTIEAYVNATNVDTSAFFVGVSRPRNLALNFIIKT
jgi:microcystin-dependent protein